MEDVQLITLINENNEEEVYEIVLTFENEETGKSYVIIKKPGDEHDEVHAFRYDKSDTDGGQLYQIEEDEEWDKVEEVLGAFFDEE